MLRRVTSGLVALLGWVAACAHAPASNAAGEGAVPPPLVQGTFEDDYGSRYEITPRQWAHLPAARYAIEAWFPDERYLLARNDPDNPSDGGLWTRIDWIVLEDGGDWTWAFCMSAYDAPTRQAAAAAHADPSRPKSGCNGFPFSRMKRR
ncbi:MAG: hypothetical protein AAF721_28765 [Myxococcota bacterium]